MRPLRFLLTLLTLVFAFFCLLFFGPWRDHDEQDRLQQRGSIGALFTWRTPSSLFPPSAIISLTDDNSTFFLARPAAFGPLLPAKSLSGQLWVGSGFGDDHLGHGGPGAGAEGELGCSDIPEWHDGNYHAGRGRLGDFKTATVKVKDSEGGKSKRSIVVEAEVDEDVAEGELEDDDGTDDHLHLPLPASGGLKSSGRPAGSTKKPTHADIQSLQETAEIAGKVVLLSRGGCGFLEKVKWAQRRGATALIIGDDIRGGPLVTMYARGDTSNVTIPALFTSHMTAHLLSSLIPSGGLLDDLSAEEIARLGLALGEKADTGKASRKSAEKPNFTTTSAAVKTTTTAKSAQKATKEGVTEDDAEELDLEAHGAGWIRSWFSARRDAGGDSRRPPTSGNLGWIQQKDFEDDGEDGGMIGKVATTSTSAKLVATKKAAHGGDGFRIGVQDWRDPDMVAEEKERQQATASASVSSSSTIVQSSQVAKQTGFKGGSITPGSGEYAKTHPKEAHTVAGGEQTGDKTHDDMEQGSHQEMSGNWFTRLFQVEPEEEFDPTPEASKPNVPPPKTDGLRAHHQIVDGMSHHEGLWVTLTPTSMSSSPFFDTLLVLVVSPLVTLTVVYALLLLRSRIRRRRWRAPKSVVERLPVRTYQTMPSTTTSSTSPASSVASSPVTATTPLLPSSARPINGRRARSRTASEVPVQPSSSVSSELAPPSLEQIEEKRAAGLAEWRRRYGGKQRECVVCLEEYVDGVSRVMSLPCGHEFHAECITPWLTTRRRTCPICKGDVVRSLARASGTATLGSSASSPLTLPPQQYRDDPEDEAADVQEQAAVARNDDPAAARPISREDEAFEDLERGVGGEGRE
ncbi:hypothetical protein LTR86_007697 [Recurvomyces mirabilis]|nr:hypothetical protein LTR86_007697 [Recurvomyces mirabilis]